MESNKIIPKGILFSFILLTTLFFAWAVPNNLTDTMLAAFKRIDVYKRQGVASIAT